MPEGYSLYRGSVVSLAVIPLVRTRALGRPFDYACDEALPVGTLVRIPLAGREVRGVVVGEANAGTRELKRAIGDGASIPADLVALALEIAARYATTPARALELVLPPTTAPAHALWVSPGPRPENVRGARQIAVAAALADGPLPLTTLRDETGATPATLRSLTARGAIVVEPEPYRAPGEVRLPVLTAAQDVAVQRLHRAIAESDPAPLLLFGVTGSGKTEVFLRGIAACLAAGRSAIVLVPEIALAPQTAARLAARFGSLVAVLHSGLSAGERSAEHVRIRTGAARVVVGPRSAILAPVTSLGLIVVDEEHDPSYKQDSDPRYDARALAVLRARHHGAAMLVASATPRPESWRALERLHLPGRIGGRLPPVEVVDLRRDGLYPLSRRLEDALGSIERDGGRSILLLNRRGEAPALHCRTCGVSIRCLHCDVSLTLHARPRGLRCHHCGYAEPEPDACPACGAVDLARIGAGTERLETLVEERFRGLTVIRLDADSTARRGALEAALERFATTDRAVLVGTQLVAKGHHFADVRLAAVIDADAGLLQPDFRAEERTFALLVQLAGRAGREGSGGRVLVQSWEPESRVIRLVARHAVAEFLDGEVARRDALGYPPSSRLVRVLVTAATLPVAERCLRDVVDAARAGLGDDQILGPAPLFRLRGRERAHVLVKTSRARRAASVLGEVAAARSRELRRVGATIVVDVDPQSL